MSAQVNGRRLRASGIKSALVLPPMFVFLAVAMIPTLIPATAAAQPPRPGRMRVIQASWHDTSPPLRVMRKHMSSRMQALRENRRLLEELNELRVIPIGHGPRAPGGPFVVRDPQVQSRMMASAPAFGYVANFDGIDYTGVIPPDPDITVGNDFVLAQVNVGFAVFDKQGETVMPPTGTRSLWQGFGGTCEVQNSGDGIVLYDRLAERWIVSQFTVGEAPYYECVAISVTNDPTGRYYRYAFKTSDADFPDYPKLGVWPDAYYASFNNFDAYGVAGVTLAAFNRAAMLAGEQAQEILFVVPKTQLGAFGLLPAELDGPTLPPAGAPGYFLSYVSPTQSGTDYYALEMREMRVDWHTPAAATLSGPVEIRVPPFNDDVCGTRGFSGSCIPQPNDAPGLNAISDRLMFRLAYRNLGTREAMVVNHTVSVGVNDQPPTGIRWYELATSAPGANDWSLAQSGTWAPADGNSRWMGSIAMDRAGDMMLGYSLSGPDMPPSVAFTGRLAGDPSDQMTLPEQIIQAGIGEQRSAFGRWGDYSSMAADPADGCTLWYVNEYYPFRGSSWQTRIAGMHFFACSGSSMGNLAGTVTSTADGSPLDGAHVRIEPGHIVAGTNHHGQYQVVLDPGNYTVSVLAYPYVQSAGVPAAVASGVTTTRDFSLKLAPMETVSGIVCDGGKAAAKGWKCGDDPSPDVHGWGMYAEVRFQTAAFGKAATAWTAPSTGAYSLKVAKGFSYTATAAPGGSFVYFGYTRASAQLTVMGPTGLDFALSARRFACPSPGYSGSGSDCTAVPGGLVVGEVTDANTGDRAIADLHDDLGNQTSTHSTPGDPGLKNIYVLFTSPGRRTLTATDFSTGTEVASKVAAKSDAGVRDDMAFGTADLAVAKIADAKLAQGASGTVEIEITNNGPDASARASLSTTADHSFVTTFPAATTQGSCGTNKQNGVDCSFGDIAPGASVSVTMRLFATYAGTAEVKATASEIDTDPDPSNNSASAKVNVVAPPSPGQGGDNGGGGLGWPILLTLLGLAFAGSLARKHHNFSTGE